MPALHPQHAAPVGQTVESQEKYSLNCENHLSTVRRTKGIPESLNILRLANEPGYRPQIKVQASCRKAATSCPARSSGRNGQLYQRYADGMEHQVSALGLVLNALGCSTFATWTPP